MKATVLAFILCILMSGCSTNAAPLHINDLVWSSTDVPVGYNIVPASVASQSGFYPENTTNPGRAPDISHQYSIGNITPADVQLFLYASIEPNNFLLGTAFQFSVDGEASKYLESAAGCQGVLESQFQLYEHAAIQGPYLLVLVYENRDEHTDIETHFQAFAKKHGMDVIC